MVTWAPPRVEGGRAASVTLAVPVVRFVPNMVMMLPGATGVPENDAAFSTVSDCAAALAATMQVNSRSFNVRGESVRVIIIISSKEIERYQKVRTLTPCKRRAVSHRRYQEPAGIDFPVRRINSLQGIVSAFFACKLLILRRPLFHSDRLLAAGVGQVGRVLTSKSKGGLARLLRQIDTRFITNDWTTEGIVSPVPWRKPGKTPPRLPDDPPS